MVEGERKEELLCEACRRPRPRYSNMLCLRCTALEIVSDRVEAWVERLGEDPRYNAGGINLYGGAEYHVRNVLMELVIEHLKSLPEHEFPQVAPKHTAPMKRLDHIRQAAEVF